MSNWKNTMLSAAGAGGGEPFATVGYTYQSSAAPGFSNVSSEPLTSLKGGDHPDGRDFVQAGDVIVIITYLGDFNTNRSLSYTGYTQGLGLYLNASGDGYNSNVYIHYKIADGTETQINQPYTSGVSSAFVAGVFSGAAAPTASWGNTVRYSTSTAGFTQSGSSTTFTGLPLSGGSYSGDSYIMYATGCSMNFARVNTPGTMDSRLNGSYTSFATEEDTDPSQIEVKFGNTQLETSETDFTFSAATWDKGSAAITNGTNFALAFRMPKA